MPFLHLLLKGAKTGWHTTTQTPEADISKKPPGAPARLADWAERRRALAAFHARHHLLVRALLLTLVWEILAQLLGYLAVTNFPPSNDPPAFFHLHPAFQHGSYPLWQTIWARWDSIWYVLLATQGYTQQVTILDAFFPAFPGLIHLVGGLFGGNYLLAGVVINRLLLFPTVGLFTQLVREESGDEAAASAPLFFLLVPAAVFFLAVYTETLFLFACIACFLALQHHRWLLAGLCCALATATRLPGIILVGAVIVEGISSQRLWRGIGAAALGLSGLVAYALYLTFSQHDPLAFQHAYQYGWGFDHHFTLNILVGPRQYLQWLIDAWPWADRGTFSTLSCVLALFLDTALLVLMWRPLRWSYRLFILGNMLLPLLSGTLFAYNRYSLVLFPFLLIACRWTAKRPTLREATLLTMGGFSILNILLFTASYWVG